MALMTQVAPSTPSVSKPVPNTNRRQQEMLALRREAFGNEESSHINAERAHQEANNGNSEQWQRFTSPLKTTNWKKPEVWL